MPDTGRQYRRLSAWFKDQCRIRGDDCWICRGSEGPIDYSVYAPKNRLAFTVDHVTPTSLGGDVHDMKGFRPAHAACNASRGNGTRSPRADTRAEARLFPTSRKWTR